MEIIVHFPTDEQELIALNDRVSNIHAEYIYSYLSKQKFTKEQTLEVIEKIKNKTE